MELASDRHIVVALHWAHQTIISGIDLLYYGYFDNNDQTETDMLGRVWGFIKECFDASQYNRKRRTGCTVSLAIQSWTRLRNLATAGMLLQSFEQSNGFDSSYNSSLLHLSEEKWQVLLPRDKGGYVFYSSFRRVWLCVRRVGSPEQGHQGSERDVNKASENAERYALQAI